MDFAVRLATTNFLSSKISIRRLYGMEQSRLTVVNRGAKKKQAYAMNQ